MEMVPAMAEDMTTVAMPAPLPMPVVMMTVPGIPWSRA